MLRTKCENDLYPEYYGQKCLCAGCINTIGCPGCEVCEGPVKKCDYPSEGEEDG